MAFLFNQMILSFFYPFLCLHCHAKTGKKGQILCPECLSFLSLEEKEGRCCRCFTPLENSACSFCKGKKRGIDRQIGVVENMGPAATLVVAAMQGERAVFSALTSLMTYQWTRFSYPFPDLIIPLPLFWTKRLFLGFDPNVYLAKLLAKEWGCPLDHRLIRVPDGEQFLTKGIFSSSFVVRTKKGLQEKRALLVSLSLDREANEKGAHALSPLHLASLEGFSFSL